MRKHSVASAMSEFDVEESTMSIALTNATRHSVVSALDDSVSFEDSSSSRTNVTPTEWKAPARPPSPVEKRQVNTARKSVTFNDYKNTKTLKVIDAEDREREDREHLNIEEYLGNILCLEFGTRLKMWSTEASARAKIGEHFHLNWLSSGECLKRKETCSEEIAERSSIATHERMDLGSAAHMQVAREAVDDIIRPLLNFTQGGGENESDSGIVVSDTSSEEYEETIFLRLHELEQLVQNEAQHRFAAESLVLPNAGCVADPVADISGLSEIAREYFQVLLTKAVMDEEFIRSVLNSEWLLSHAAGISSLAHSCRNGLFSLMFTLQNEKAVKIQAAARSFLTRRHAYIVRRAAVDSYLDAMQTFEQRFVDQVIIEEDFSPQQRRTLADQAISETVARAIIESDMQRFFSELFRDQRLLKQSSGRFQRPSIPAPGDRSTRESDVPPPTQCVNSVHTGMFETTPTTAAHLRPPRRPLSACQGPTSNGSCSSGASIRLRQSSLPKRPQSPYMASENTVDLLLTQITEQGRSGRLSRPSSVAAAPLPRSPSPPVSGANDDRVDFRLLHKVAADVLFRFFGVSGGRHVVLPFALAMDAVRGVQYLQKQQALVTPTEYRRHVADVDPAIYRWDDGFVTRIIKKLFLVYDSRCIDGSGTQHGRPAVQPRHVTIDELLLAIVASVLPQSQCAATDANGSGDAAVDHATSSAVTHEEVEGLMVALSLALKEVQRLWTDAPTLLNVFALLDFDRQRNLPHALVRQWIGPLCSSESLNSVSETSNNRGYSFLEVSSYVESLSVDHVQAATERIFRQLVVVRLPPPVAERRRTRETVLIEELDTACVTLNAAIRRLGALGPRRPTAQTPIAELLISLLQDMDLANMQTGHIAAFSTTGFSPFGLAALALVVLVALRSQFSRNIPAAFAVLEEFDAENPPIDLRPVKRGRPSPTAVPGAGWQDVIKGFGILLTSEIFLDELSSRSCGVSVRAGLTTPPRQRTDASPADQPLWAGIPTATLPLIGFFCSKRFTVPGNDPRSQQCNAFVGAVRQYLFASAELTAFKMAPATTADRLGRRAIAGESVKLIESDADACTALEDLIRSLSESRQAPFSAPRRRIAREVDRSTGNQNSGELVLFSERFLNMLFLADAEDTVLPSDVQRTDPPITGRTAASGAIASQYSYHRTTPMFRSTAMEPVRCEKVVMRIPSRPTSAYEPRAIPHHTPYAVTL